MSTSDSIQIIGIVISLILGSLSLCLGVKNKIDVRLFCKNGQIQESEEQRGDLYRGVKDTNAFRLEIGDIRDITELEKSQFSIQTKEDIILFGQKNNSID